MPSSPTLNNQNLGFHLESPSLWREEEEHPDDTFKKVNDATTAPLPPTLTQGWG
jgi:hypothetical protein